MLTEHSPLTRFQIHPYVRTEHSPKNPVLANTIADYLMGCIAEKKSPKTISTYAERLKDFSEFLSRNAVNPLPGDITRKHVRNYLVELQLRNLASSTINAYYRSLRTFFNRLYEEETIPENPMEHIKPPKVEDRLPHPFSDDHIRMLLNACSNHRYFMDIRNRAMVLMFMDTGLRLGELLNIQLDDLTNDASMVSVMGKGAKERIVKMGREAQKAMLYYLNTRDDKEPCLWVSEERRPITYYGMKSIIRKLCLRAGVKGVKLGAHTFRHYFATQSFVNGAREYEVQLLLGHSTMKMTQRYQRTVNTMMIHQEAFSPVDIFMKQSRRARNGIIPKT